VKLDNPTLVRWEYASEERLAKRNAVLRSLSQGRSPEDAAFDAVAEQKPQRVLDVGCGLGELGERFQQELGAYVCAIDISPRMVELAKARGLDAQLADVERLPFNDDSFDCVFAGWVLYHVPDLDRAVAECARVLTREGVLVAASVCNENIDEVWQLIGVTERRDPLSFSWENGESVLAPHFGKIERRDFDGEVVFPDTESLRTFVASTIDRAHLAPQVPEISEPFRARTRHVVFVATHPKQ
jgi:ubiquinone/menaquinone biosynthesis C-methylase UbiE